MSTQQAVAVMGPGADFLAEEESVQNLDDHPMAQLLEEFDDSYVNQPQTGDIRHGVVVDKRSGELLIDIGYKSEGIVAGREVDRLEDEFKEMTIGDEVPVYVMREDRDGNLLLSISRARAESDWKRAEELLESQDMFTRPCQRLQPGRCDCQNRPSARLCPCQPAEQREPVDAALRGRA